jgi:hypothetical protein
LVKVKNVFFKLTFNEKNFCLLSSNNKVIIFVNNFWLFFSYSWFPLYTQFSFLFFQSIQKYNKQKSKSCLGKAISDLLEMRRDCLYCENFHKSCEVAEFFPINVFRSLKKNLFNLYISSLFLGLSFFKIWIVFVQEDGFWLSSCNDFQ